MRGSSLLVFVWGMVLLGGLMIASGPPYLSWALLAYVALIAVWASVYSRFGIRPKVAIAQWLSLWVVLTVAAFIAEPSWMALLWGSVASVLVMLIWMVPVGMIYSFVAER